MLCLLSATVVIGAFLLRRDNSLESRLDGEFARAVARAKAEDGSIALDPLVTDMQLALRTIGPEAMPVMLKWIKRSATPGASVRKHLAKLGLFLGTSSPQFWAFVRDDESRLRAHVAGKTFFVFGTNAAPVVPQLEELATNGNRHAEMAVRRLRTKP